MSTATDSGRSTEVIWVTGAASGIGRALTESLVQEGASVVASDIDADALAWAENQPRIATCLCNVSQAADNERAVATALDRFGTLSGIALNAGVSGAAPIDAADALALLEQNLAVNLVGVVHGVRAALPAFRQAGGGSITVTASTSGIGGDPTMWPYNAAKGGVINLVRSLAVELAPENIRVNAVAPGPTVTGMTQGMLDGGANPVNESLRQRIPMQRWGTAAEPAAAHAWLLSSAASFVTGIVLPVDGGITANSGQFDPLGGPAVGGVRP
ncbi:MAG: SDR family oxidoreductase [Pseudomonadota bacterium]